MPKDTMPKDKLFDKPMNKVDDFKFNSSVVTVFDDMVSRSVPFYHEIQRMMTEIAADFAVSGKSVYDLGCSTGTTLVNLDRSIDPAIPFVGIDNSPEMLDQCRANFEAAGMKRQYDLRLVDLNQGITLDKASVVVMCLTLQFVRPIYREKLVEDICHQLDSFGCLILVERFWERIRFSTACSSNTTMT